MFSSGGFSGGFGAKQRAEQREKRLFAAEEGAEGPRDLCAVRPICVRAAGGDLRDECGKRFSKNKKG